MYRANMATSKSNLYETDWLLSSLLSNLSLDHGGKAFFLGIRHGKERRGEGVGDMEKKGQMQAREEDRGSGKKEVDCCYLLITPFPPLIIIIFGAFFKIIFRTCAHSLRAHTQQRGGRLETTFFAQAPFGR
jgi:hypothetical protein